MSKGEKEKEKKGVSSMITPMPIRRGISSSVALLLLLSKGYVALPLHSFLFLLYFFLSFLTYLLTMRGREESTTTHFVYGLNRFSVW